MSSLLCIDGLSKSYSGPRGSIEALGGVSLSMDAGEFVVVHGPSGCGKTTLLLAVGALLRPTLGHVVFDGQNPYALSPARRAQFRALNIGFVFQQFHLVPYLNVLENILASTLAVSTGGDARERGRQLAGRFGLIDRLQHLPSALSTGERQRVALARALFNNPKLLLADEPTGNLDEQNGRIVLASLSEFAAQGGSVLLVSHELRAGEYAQRIMRMNRGRFE
jgi:putative ABC transport system ATP-binding protein